MIRSMRRRIRGSARRLRASACRTQRTAFAGSSSRAHGSTSHSHAIAHNGSRRARLRALCSYRSTSSSAEPVQTRFDIVRTNCTSCTRRTAVSSPTMTAHLPASTVCEVRAKVTTATAPSSHSLAHAAAPRPQHDSSAEHFERRQSACHRLPTRPRHVHPSTVSSSTTWTEPDVGTALDDQVFEPRAASASTTRRLTEITCVASRCAKATDPRRASALTRTTVAPSSSARAMFCCSARRDRRR